jgi:hypothetical protein
MNCEECSPEPEERETEWMDVDGTGKFHLNVRYAFITWAKSTIDDKEDFHLKLMTQIPEISQVLWGHEWGGEIFFWLGGRWEVEEVLENLGPGRGVLLRSCECYTVSGGVWNWEQGDI